MAKDRDPIEKGVEELGEEITCAVCHEHYLDPKILPCCHYYCKRCVRAMADRGNPFACPQCRRPAQLPANRDPAVLPTAYFINRIKDVHGKMEKARGRVAARCEMCGAGKAEAFCRQCTEFICAECARYHEKLKVKYPGHKVVSLEELRVGGAKQIPPTPAPPTMCETHDERMKLYCFDCGRLICRDCTVIDHAGHKFEFAKKCAVEHRAKAVEGNRQLAEFQSELSDAIKCTKARECEIHNQGRQISASITIAFKKFRRILACHEARLQKEASDLVELKVTSLTAQDKNLHLALAESLADFVRRNTEDATDEELMTIHKQMESNIEEQRQRFAQLNREPVEEADVSKKISIATALQQVTADITLDYPQNTKKQGVQQLPDWGRALFDAPTQPGSPEAPAPPQPHSLEAPPPPGTPPWAESPRQPYSPPPALAHSGPPPGSPPWAESLRQPYSPPPALAHSGPPPDPWDESPRQPYSPPPALSHSGPLPGSPPWAESPRQPYSPPPALSHSGPSPDPWAESPPQPYSPPPALARSGPPSQGRSWPFTPSPL